MKHVALAGWTAEDKRRNNQRVDAAGKRRGTHSGGVAKLGLFIPLAS